MKSKIILLVTVGFLLFFLLIHYVHFIYWYVDVVFYAALIDVLVAVIAMAFVLYFYPLFKVLTSWEKRLLVLLWLLMGYGFSISVPTVVDRSLSFYILEKIQQRGGGIKEDSFESMFVNEYMKEHRLIDIRLTEQLKSGTISINSGCVRLTKKGEFIAAISRYYRKNFLPKQRLLKGEYSDVLTDPFRSSSKVSDYMCD